MTIRYYVTRQRKGRPKLGYWAPCLARRNSKTGQIEPTLMAKLGFKLVDCGEDGPAAWSIAEGWNKAWDEAYAKWRAGAIATEPQELERVFPVGSIGAGFAQLRGTGTWETKKKTTQDDWWRGWKYIEPVFGDVDGTTVTMEDIDLWYLGDTKKPDKVPGLKRLVGVRESHRAMKIWRALWNALASLKRPDTGERYVTGKDPSLGVRRENPQPRQAIWLYQEAMPLIAAAWTGVTHEGKHKRFPGLAAALAVAWDSMLSPVDVRSLSLSMLIQTDEGPVFDLDRTKTGKDALATLSEDTARLMGDYLAKLPFTLHPETPIFHTRGGAPGPKGGKPRPPAPYTKDTLSKDFRVVREAVYPGDKRQIADFRRSGALEAKAGKVDLLHLRDKMANTIDTNSALQRAYLPAHTTLVREADAARERGRVLLMRKPKKDGAA